MTTTGSLSNTTTTRKDGVRVDKGIEPGENHMRVHYRIVSEREDDAAIRVEESLAAAFPLDALDERAVANALPEGAIVDAFVADVEANALSDAQRDALREHLAPAAARSDDLRLAQLRARLEDFAAYADGLEAIIDEHGTATELVDGLRRDFDDDFASVRTALETLERTCEESMTELAAFASDLEEDVVEIDRWREQVGQAFTATETAARAPGSIFRAEADDGTTAPDAGTNASDAGTGASDATEDSGDPPAEADGGLDYDPTRDDGERDADGD